MADFLSAEDTVVYRLYPKIHEGAEIEAELTEQALRFLHVAKTLTHNHIWHYEPFRLAVCSSQSTVAHIEGSTCYRDNVEDEWTIVSLLLSLTKDCPDLVASVQDNDGEFLLVEAAHHLPQWANPDTAVNRVFLCGGHVHLIPLPATPAELATLPTGTPSLSRALALVREGGVTTLAPSKVQEAVHDRISRCLHLHHRAHCLLPIPVAHALSLSSPLVSAAVHALCDRSPDDVKACGRLVHVGPHLQSGVVCEVTFTRLLYAKLMYENFSAPKHLISAIGGSRSKKSSSSKLHQLGVKLTCGVEILLSCYSKASAATASKTTSMREKKWSRFVSSLSGKGYFQGELEGSRLYQELLATAREFYHHSLANEDRGDTMFRSVLEEAGNSLATIFEAQEWSQATLQEREQSLPPADDDSWLELSAEQLDEMMYAATGNRPPPQESSLDLENMVFGMKSFVESMSSHAGAELPWTANDTTPVEFDPEKFIDSLNAMLGMKDGDEELSDSVGESESEGEEQEEMVQLMQEMDRQLEGTAVAGASKEEEDPAHQDESQPVRVDFGVVRNLLESHEAQMGGSGPTSNILHALGITIPRDDHN